MKPLTPEQKRATRPAANVWVRASAGTGKTHVLSARVLRMMLTGTPPENILCLTYTKAAAAEMAMRITETLGRWVMANPAALAREIEGATGEQADEEMIERARSLFAHVLEIPGGLRIDTIHAFCQSLLKRFPVEANLSPHFTVVEERTAQEFVLEAVGEVMAAATEGRDAALRAAFERVAAEQGEAGFRNLIGELMAKRRQLARLLMRYGGEDNLAAAVYRALDVRQDENEESLIAAALEDKAFDDEGLKRLAHALSEGTDAEKKRGLAIAAFLTNPGQRRELFDSYREVFLTKAGDARKGVVTKATVGADPALEAIIAAEQRRLIGMLEKIALLQVAEKTAALIRIGAAVVAALEQRKRLYGALDYEDLILKTEELLQRPGIEAWIRYKLDGQIDHILVDEGQDTNRVQWQLVERLSEEFYAGESARGELVRTVFAVGDIKQSIFSFQGAEPWEFRDARLRIAERVRQARLAFEERPLHESFRSTRAVLDMVDAAFSLEALKGGVALDEEKIRHEARRIGHAGLVELWPAEPAPHKEKPVGWQLPLKQKFEDTAEARLARRIAEKIYALVENGEELPARGRKIRYGDVMVLVRKRGAFIDHLLRELKARRVPVAGADRMKLSEQLAVEDLLAAARFALLPEDDYTLACVLKGPLVGLSEEALYRLARGRDKQSLWAVLRRKAKGDKTFGNAEAFLAGLLREADFVPPYRFFAGVLEGAGGRRKLAARLGAEINDPVDEFLGLALAFEAEHTPSLQGFLSWFASAETEIKRDMERGTDEVRIMTIHGAKGLEAPVVFLPDTCQVPRGDTGGLLELPTDDGDPLLVWAGAKAFAVGPLRDAREATLARQHEEYNRLLYVALTRAEDRLYISGFETVHKTPEDAWHPLLKQALEGIKGVERVADVDGRPVLRLEGVQERAAEPDGEKLSPAVADIRLPDWIKKKAPAEKPPYRPIAPSRAVARERPLRGAGKAERRAVQRGAVIHKLLEMLPRCPKGKRKQAAMTYLGLAAFGLKPKERAEIWRKVKAVLEDPRFGPLFGKGSRAEVAVSGRLGKIDVSGQVDRLLVTETEVLIVDFKAGGTAPRKKEQIPPAYVAQLAAYAGLFGRVYPKHTVRAALLWVEEAKLMEVSDEMLKRAPLDGAGTTT